MRFFSSLSSLSVLGGLGLLLLASAPAQAQTFTTNFPTASSTGLGAVSFNSGSQSFGAFFRTGDGISAALTTGLTSVDSLGFTIPIASNSLNSGASVIFDVRLNGTTVGTASVLQGATGALTFASTFSSVNDAGGNYTLAIVETNAVPGGAGSLRLGVPGSVTLSSSSTAAPEPGSLALLLPVFGVAGMVIRKRRKN